VNSLERRASRTHRTLTSTTEIYASTKPYPSWWSDLEDSRVLQRRKSLGEIVLERNLCFVDTNSSRGQTDDTVQYMCDQFLRAINALNSSSVDFQNLLAGNGGSQVDVILYLISNGRFILGFHRKPSLTNISVYRHPRNRRGMHPQAQRAKQCNPTHIQIRHPLSSPNNRFKTVLP
jgi:hypothetical protein